MALNVQNVPAHIRVLSADDKQIGNVQKNANGLLAAILRKLFYDMNLSPMAYEQMIENYLATQNGGEVNRLEKTNTRSALNNELFADAITFKVLIKALKILQMDKVEIEIRGIKHNREYKSMISAILSPNVLQEVMNEALFRENKKATVRQLEDTRDFNTPPEANTQVEKPLSPVSTKRDRELAREKAVQQQQNQAVVETVDSNKVVRKVRTRKVVGEEPPKPKSKETGTALSTVVRSHTDKPNKKKGK
jgi:hypothetical protein